MRRDLPRLTLLVFSRFHLRMSSVSTLKRSGNATQRLPSPHAITDKTALRFRLLQSSGIRTYRPRQPRPRSRMWHRQWPPPSHGILRDGRECSPDSTRWRRQLTHLPAELSAISAEISQRYLRKAQLKEDPRAWPCATRMDSGKRAWRERSTSMVPPPIAGRWPCPASTRWERAPRVRWTIVVRRILGDGVSAMDDGNEFSSRAEDYPFVQLPGNTHSRCAEPFCTFARGAIVGGIGHGPVAELLVEIAKVMRKQPAWPFSGSCRSSIPPGVTESYFAAIGHDCPMPRAPAREEPVAGTSFPLRPGKSNSCGENLFAQHARKSFSR